MPEALHNWNLRLVARPGGPAWAHSASHCAAICRRRGLQVATDVAEALHFLHTKLQIMHSDMSGA